MFTIRKPDFKVQKEKLTMAVNESLYNELKAELNNSNVQLIAVSKLKSCNEIQDLYNLGQLDFAENYVQELLEKQQILAGLQINWHFIGHLQSNKVKYIAPFVHLIQSVDSLKLLKEINKQAKKCNRTIDCLLQVYIAKEESKFGLTIEELNEIFEEVSKKQLKNIRILGFMGMASFSDDEEVVRNEFKNLNSLFNKYSSIEILSMGMSQDYKLAIKNGSNMVRIGSLLFGVRQ